MTRQKCWMLVLGMLSYIDVVDGQGKCLVALEKGMDRLNAIILMDAPEDLEERLKFVATKGNRICRLQNVCGKPINSDSIVGPDSEKCELVTPIDTYADMELLQELVRQLLHAGGVSTS